MLRKRIPWIVLTLFTLVLFGTIVFTRHTEPRLDGKTLTQWIILYRTNSVPGPARSTSQAETAEKAIKEIGTNGLPTLIKMLKAGKDWHYRLIEKFPPKLVPKFLKPAPLDDIHNLASHGLALLGPKAAPVLPDLILLLKSEDQWVRMYAANELQFIGPAAKEAIPVLLKLLDNRGDGLLLLGVFDALRGIHSEPKMVLPVLARFINGDRVEWNYLNSAIDALRYYDDEAFPFIPALDSIKNNLTHDQSVRDRAESVSWNLKEKQKKKIQAQIRDREP